MTAAPPSRTFALECVLAAAERIDKLAARALREPQPPWLLHRLDMIRADAQAFAAVVRDGETQEFANHE